MFATGHSNGADFCYYLALQPDTFVRAIAPMAGTMMVSWKNYFPYQKRLSVMETHGTADDTTPWAGDMKDTYYGPYYGTEEVILKWVKWLSLEEYEQHTLPQPKWGYKTDRHLY